MNNFSVLIVDDEYHKIEKINSILKDLNIDISNVDHSSCLSKARFNLSQKKYQLVILDLKVASNFGDPSRVGAGMEFLEMLRLSNDPIKTPNYIFGLTAIDDHFIGYREKFKSYGWLLEKFSNESDDWIYPLKSLLSHALKSHREVNSYPEVDIAVITALYEPEFKEVLDLDCDWKHFTIAGDSTTYYLGVIASQDRKYTIVAAHAARKGMPSSSALATKIALKFNPKYLVMLGICAGIKPTVNIGDVIFGDPTWDWGSGKHKKVADSKVFNAAPVQKEISSELRAAIQRMIIKDDATEYLRRKWKGAVPNGKLSIKLGPMASGAGVLADEEITLEIRDTQNKDIVAIEMEAFAVMSAMEYAINPQPQALIIKSVCDFADESKNDLWQKYASFTSANTFFHFFKNEFKF